MAERWATFDCYGTLIDWDGGIRRGLVEVFGAEGADELLARYHEIEPRIQAAEPALSYREVMARTLDELGAPAEQRGALGDALPSWAPFPEVPAALEEARGRGWRLAILSNTDRDFIEASKRQIGVQFDVTIVASEVGSYKPALGHWRAFEEEVGRDAGRPRRCEPFPRRRPGERPRPADRLGQPAPRSTATRRRRARSAISRPLRTCSTSSSPRDAGVPRGARARTPRPLPSSATRSNAPSRTTPSSTSAGGHPALVAPRDARRALVLDDGQLVGFAYVRRRGDRWDGDGYVHPDAFGRGVGTAIVEWIEERARAHGSAETRIATLAQDERAACLLRSRGFAPVRTFFRMMIELAEQPPPPGWPDGYVVATLRPGEERALYEVLEDAFLDHWDHNARTYDEWLATQKIVHDLCFLVRAGDELAAAALCKIDDFGLGWVDVLGTRREHRRRGLGEALLGQSFHSSTRGARARSLSASTPRTRPARPGSTSASACESPPGSTSTPRSCR